MFINRSFILLFFVTIFLGCSETQSVEFPMNETISLTRIEPTNRGKVKDFTVKDKEYIELSDWLKNNNEGWVRIEIEIYPTHLIKSGKYWIGVVEDKALIFHQMYIDSTYVYQKSLKENDLSFLNKGSFKYKDENKHNKTFNHAGPLALLGPSKASLFRARLIHR